MIEPKLVSIILPTRNRANSLRKCLDSILAQAYSNWELIIVDGASTDDTPLVARQYAEADSRICYHRSFPRQGLPRDRNIGVSLARGTLVFMMEDDLIPEPDCLPILVETLEELQTDEVKVGAVGPRTFLPPKELLGYKEAPSFLKRIQYRVGDCKRKDMNSPCLFDKRTGIVYLNWSIDCGDIQQVVALPSWSVFPRDVFQQVGGYEGKAYNKANYVHDEDDFYFRIRKAGYKLYFQPKARTYHERGDIGGGTVTPVRYSYYYVIGHIIFLRRIFGWKSLYMVPFFLSFIIFNMIKYSVTSLTNRRNE